jgi:hypothetical protein
MIIAFAAKIFLLCLKQILFETDHVIRIRRWQRRTADTKRWSDRLSRTTDGDSASLGHGSRRAVSGAPHHEDL